MNLPKFTDLAQIKNHALEDHYFFSRDVFNYKRLRDRPHKELTNFLVNSTKRTKVILMPRGSFKSSHVTVGYSGWKMAQNPNIRILISSETQRNALKYVSEIKGHIETNVKFRALFGDWVNKGNIWRANEFVIKARTTPKKEATITAGSLEKGTQVGQHYDLCILDDVVSANNIANEDQIQKTIDHYKLLLSILDPGGEIIVVGTRWGHYELYSWLLDPEGPEFGQVDLFHRAAEDDAGNLLMPEILSREFLEQQRKTQGEFIYTCQYLNKISSTDNNTFKEGQLQYYEESPKGLIYFMTVDPAIGLHARSDFSGIVVNGVDYDSNWFIQEAIQVKVEPNDLINLIFELVRKYQPMMCVAMEKFAMEKFLKLSLLSEMQKRNFFFALKDLETNTRISKNTRIRALQPIFENKKIYLKREHRSLIHQILYHPSLKHDDIIDALKSQLPIVFPSDVKPEVKLEGVPLKPIDVRAWEDLKLATRKVRRVSSYEEF